MNLARIALAGICIFALCLAAVRTPIANVKAQENRTIHVYITHAVVSDSKDSRSSLDIPGGKIVGFSCISKPASITREKNAVCFIASSQ